MISSAILIAKLLFSRFLAAASEFLTFCVKHWRIILPCLIVGLTYLAFVRVLGQRDDWHNKYDTMIADNKAAAEKRKQENLQKDATNQRNFDALMANHLATVNQLRNDYAKLKGEKTTLQGTAADLQRDIGNWRQRVRLEVAKNATGLSDVSQPAGGSTESGGDGNAASIGSAYATLDLACSVTTIDYNALWQAWQSACTTYGCK